MNKNLELLSYSRKFQIKKTEENVYKIEHTMTNLGATINKDNEIKYYVTGCYDSGCDWEQIDLEYFIELKEFCELMIK